MGFESFTWPALQNLAPSDSNISNLGGACRRVLPPLPSAVNFRTYYIAPASYAVQYCRTYCNTAHSRCALSWKYGGSIVSRRNG